MRVVDNKDACALSPDDGPITLLVAFGDGQVGTSMVVVGGIVIAAGADLTVPLGDAASLAGTSAVVRSLVSQTNPATNHFSVVHGVSGNRTHESYVVSDGFNDDESAVIAETIMFALKS
jgi:hypothetical protein